jgi:hypothetical protein
MDLILIILATAALHRLWNQEAVFEPVRRLMAKAPRLTYPLRCATCNAMWFSLLGYALWAPEAAGPLAGMRTILVLWLGVVVVHVIMWRITGGNAPATLNPKTAQTQRVVIQPSQPAKVLDAAATIRG